jgi:hypothetical protein
MDNTIFSEPGEEETAFGSVSLLLPDTNLTSRVVGRVRTTT